MSDLLIHTSPLIEEREGRKALVVGGFVQSIAVDADHVWDVWDALIPRQRHPWRVLILGNGGGTVATLLTQRYGPIAITAVERDPEIARLSREEFGLNALTNVTLIEADAFAWVDTCDQMFDFICVDMYIAGELAHRTLATPFLRRLASLLIPEGIVVFNLFRTRRIPEQLHRLQHVFTIMERIEVGGNIVVHLRRN